MRRSRERYVYVDVDLDDFSDEDLLLECKARGMLLAARPSDDDARSNQKLDDVISDAMGAIMRKRLDEAETIVADLIEAVVGPRLLMAYAALRDGHASDALCHLDSHIRPPPAATATALFPEPPTSSV